MLIGSVVVLVVTKVAVVTAVVVLVVVTHCMSEGCGMCWCVKVDKWLGEESESGQLYICRGRRDLV